MPRSAALATAVLLAGCAAMSGTPSGTLPVAGTFATGRGLFSSGAVLTVRAAARNADGRMEVCAAWDVAGETARDTPYLNDALDLGVLQIGGRPVRIGFSSFPRGSIARCVITGTAWAPGWQRAPQRIVFNRMVFERDDEDGITLSFRGAP